MKASEILSENPLSGAAGRLAGSALNFDDPTNIINKLTKGLNTKGFASAKPASRSMSGSSNYTGGQGEPIPLSALPKSNTTRIDPKVMGSYLKSKGLDSKHIAGLLVSVKWECGFKPGVWIASDAGQGPSGGLFGFHNVRKDGTGLFTKMIWACGGLDNWQSNWQGQFDFALQSNVAKQYLSTTFRSPGDAAAWWVRNYEKPKDTEGQAVARAKEASRYAYA